MKIQKVILTETRNIAIGILICDAVMLAVFALIGKFDYTVPLGALLGSVFAVANFFWMGVCLQKALSMGDAARGYTQRMFALRMLFCLAGMVLGVALPCFHSVAALIPFLMPKIVIYAMQIFKSIRPGAKPETSEESEEE